jgi:L-fucose dehydrogenase
LEYWIRGLKNPDEKIKEIISEILPDKRMTGPAEIAYATAFLLSEKSSHTTGQLIHMAGYGCMNRALTNI